MPLVQGVSGLGAEDPGCLFLLEVLDESHGPVRTGEVVATWEREGWGEGESRQGRRRPRKRNIIHVNMGMLQFDCGRVNVSTRLYEVENDVYGLYVGEEYILVYT